MDIVNLAIKCIECCTTVKTPVLLPCGASICQKHLANLQGLSYLCVSCGQQHKIETNQMNVNKALEILVNANVEKLNLGLEYQLAVDACNQLHETITDLQTLKKDPLQFVKQTICTLKNRTELIRDNHKFEIDQFAGEIIKKLDNYEKECIAGLESSDLKAKLAKIDENVRKFNDNLLQWKKTLNDLGSDEKQRKTIKEKSKQSELMLKYDSWDIKNDLLAHKLDRHFTPVEDFENINVTINTSIDKELPELNQNLKYMNTLNSGTIEEAKKLGLFKLCNISCEKKLRLLYKASHDFSAKDFHSKCDYIPNTLTIVKSTNGWIFGGYTSQTWDQSNNYKNDPNAFLFSLANPDKLPEKLSVENKSTAIFCGERYGPTFGCGHDLYIIGNNKNSSNLGFSYSVRSKSANKKWFTESQYFTISNIEIYQFL